MGFLKDLGNKVGGAVSSVVQPVLQPIKSAIAPVTSVTSQFDKYYQKIPGVKQINALPGYQQLKDIYDPLGILHKSGDETQSAYDLPNDPSKIDYSNLENAREQRLQNLSAQESQMGAELATRTSNVNQAIDNELKQLTADLGYRSDQARQTVAGNAADRGLLRSSLAGEQIGEVSKQQLQEKAGLEAQNRAKKLGASQAAVDAVNEIGKQRQALSDQIREANLEQLQTINEQFSMQSIRNNFEKQLTEMDIDAATKAGLLGALGGIVGAGAGYAASKG